MKASMNIANLLRDEAAAQPRARAVVFKTGRTPEGHPQYAHYTFDELDKRSDFLAHGMFALGIRPKMKVLLMIRPSLDFYALVFALFKIGAPPVMIDPGMGWPGFLKCVSQVEPEAFIGVPEAHLLRIFCGRAFKSVRINISLGRFCFWGGCRLADIPGKEEPYEIFRPEAGETAAILFTSGSTGPAKGVTYTHEIFATQIEQLRSLYHIGRGDIDLACFPLFSLFTVGLGACAVVPKIDPTHPADADPREIIEPIENLGVTYSFGSPTLWDRVSRYCVRNNIKLHGLTRVIMAGSPVPGRVHDALLNHVLDRGAETYTPYGATESLPVANFTGTEMLRETASLTAQGRGMCVGKPVDITKIAIIRITDDPIETFTDDLRLPQGEIGEICASGPCVTREYYRRPEATRLAKMHDASGALWHRIGDLAYLDETGRIWFCGRKAHRVETSPGHLLFSVRCEAIFNAIPGVRRSALVGIGHRPNQTPVIIIEPEPEQYRELTANPKLFLDAAAANPLTSEIHHVLFRHAFPVDVRHNAKINREELSTWAQQLLKR